MNISIVNQTNHLQQMLQGLEASTESYQFHANMLLGGIAIFFNLLSSSIEANLLYKELQKTPVDAEIDSDDELDERMRQLQATEKQMYQKICQIQSKKIPFFHKPVLSVNEFLMRRLYQKIEVVRQFVLEHDADVSLLHTEAKTFTNTESFSDYLDSL
jgi:hypothetical protein